MRTQCSSKEGKWSSSEKSSEREERTVTAGANLFQRQNSIETRVRCKSNDIYYFSRKSRAKDYLYCFITFVLCCQIKFIVNRCSFLFVFSSMCYWNNNSTVTKSSIQITFPIYSRSYWNIVSKAKGGGKVGEESDITEL